MATVFAAAGFDVPAAAVAAHALRRGDAALRRPTAPTCASAWRSPTSARRCAASEFKVFERRARRRRRRARRSTPARASCRARSSTSSPRSSSSYGAKAARVGVRRGRRRRGARRSRSSSRRSEIAAVDASARRVARRPAAVRRRPARGRRDGARRAAAGAGAALRPRSPTAATTCCWVVDFPMFERDDGGALGRAAPPVHRADGRPSTRPRRAALARLRPRRSTARSSAAARSASTTPTCSSRVFELLGMDAEEAQARFGFLLDALRYGAPPHGGIALGHRPHRRAARRPRLDPRRDRLPEDRQRRGPADRRAGRRSTRASCASSACGCAEARRPWAWTSRSPTRCW